MEESVKYRRLTVFALVGLGVLVGGARLGRAQTVGVEQLGSAIPPISRTLRGRMA